MNRGMFDGENVEGLDIKVENIKIGCYAKIKEKMQARG